MHELAPAPNRDYLPIIEADKPREECGVLAFWDPDNEAILDQVFQGLLELQHRGEEGAGVAGVSPTELDFCIIRGPGKVREVFGKDGEELLAFPADTDRGIGHTRYGTDKGEGVQPRKESLLVGAHNGQLTNAEELAAAHEITEYATDSDLIFKIINKVALAYNGDVERATLLTLPELKGAFSLAILTKDKLILARDHNGIRPYHFGRTKTGGYVAASELPVLEKMGAIPEREIAPGEMIVISNRGVSSGQWAEPDPAACAFEFVYLSNKFNVIDGRQVRASRREAGALMAKLLIDMVQKKGGVVIPIPNTANQAAHGFAEASGLPYLPAFIKNKVDKKKQKFGRSFIQPSKEKRHEVAAGKSYLDPLISLDGETGWIIDDSLVRGITLQEKTHQLRKAGMREVHVVIASPQYEDGCELGVDTGRKEELLSVQMDGDVEKMREYLGVDSLHFLPLEKLRQAIGRKVCDACIGGEQPSLLSRPNVPAIVRPRSPEDNIPKLALA